MLSQLLHAADVLGLKQKDGASVFLKGREICSMSIPYFQL